MGFETKAFGAQDALVAALKADSGLAAWTIDYGLPSRRDEQHIWVDEKLSDWNQANDTTGLVSKQENFQMQVYVYSRMTGATAEEQRDDIRAAADIISGVIGSAPFLGGAVFYARISSAEFDTAYADPEGRQREGVLVLTIQCSAYLSA